jgi:hypothetical protein
MADPDMPDMPDLVPTFISIVAGSCKRLREYSIDPG